MGARSILMTDSTGDLMTRMGRFIVFDGGEGAGKGTVLERLKEEPALGDAVFTREPGGTPLAEQIRVMLLGATGSQMSPLTQFNLFWSARSDHLHHKITPALLEGRHVICDRFDSSTFAYQIKAQGHEMLVPLFWEVRREHLKYVPQPFYIYLDVDPEIGLYRVKGRDEINHFDQRDVDFHSRVRDGYHDFFRSASGFSSALNRHEKGSDFEYRIVDANRPLEVVVPEVLEMVRIALA